MMGGVSPAWHHGALQQWPWVLTGTGIREVSGEREGVEIEAVRTGLAAACMMMA
jgi:hypothetical protein